MGKKSAIKNEFEEVQIDGQIYMASRYESERLTPNPADIAWLEAAKESIKSAKISYDNGLYPSAVYNCQWKNRSRLGQCAGADWDTFDGANLMIFSETVAF